jgi:hypothetical protein
MKKLFLTFMLIAGLMLGSCVGMNKGSMTPDTVTMPGIEYQTLDFFDNGTSYFIPIHIRVLEPIWTPGVSRLTDTILTMNFTIPEEQVTFIINDEKMTILALLFAKNGEDTERYIYDGKPYPIKVTEAEMDAYMDTQSEQEDI